MKIVLTTIISRKKSRFSLGRSIYEGIIVVHEAIHSLKLAREMGMMIKLDIKKVYDNVNRAFLLQVLNQFGFSFDWCKWIRSCISTPRIFILINGSPYYIFVIQGVTGWFPMQNLIVFLQEPSDLLDHDLAGRSCVLKNMIVLFLPNFPSNIEGNGSP